MKKTIFILFFTIGLLFSFSLSPNARGNFNDVHLYKGEINYLADLEIIEGYGDIFKPWDPVRRVQAIQIILREKGIKDFSDVPDPGFTDINKGDYGYEEVAKAVEMGWIGGKTAEDGSKYFDTWGSLTRGQMAKIIVKAYDLTGSNSANFSDVLKSHWAYGHISTLIHHRITTGYDNNTFRPQEVISRQHFSVFLARQINNDFRNPEIDITYRNGSVYFHGITLGSQKSEVIKQLGNPDSVSPSEMNPGEIYFYNPSPLFDDVLDVYFDPSGEVAFINYRTFTSFPQSVIDSFVYDFSGDIYGENKTISQSDDPWLHYYFPAYSNHVFMTDSEVNDGVEYRNRFKLGPYYQGVPIEKDEYFKKMTTSEVLSEYSYY
ncbi:S-layer homology domain-containing protein [Bacillus sp. AK031]